MSFSEKVHTVSIASDLRFAVRITNRNRNQMIARFGALSGPISRGFLRDPRSGVTPKWGFGLAMLAASGGRIVLLPGTFWAH